MISFNKSFFIHVINNWSFDQIIKGLKYLSFMLHYVDEGYGSCSHSNKYIYIITNVCTHSLLSLFSQKERLSIWLTLILLTCIESFFICEDNWTNFFNQFPILPCYIFNQITIKLTITSCLNLNRIYKQILPCYIFNQFRHYIMKIWDFVVWAQGLLLGHFIIPYILHDNYYFHSITFSRALVSFTKIHMIRT